MSGRSVGNLFPHAEDATWEDGDVDGSGVVDQLDIDMAFAQWGLEYTNWVA
jgi:hypothetical protein